MRSLPCLVLSCPLPISCPFFNTIVVNCSCKFLGLRVTSLFPRAISYFSIEARTARLILLSFRSIPCLQMKHSQFKELLYLFLLQFFLLPIRKTSLSFSPCPNPLCACASKMNCLVISLPFLSFFILSGVIFFLGPTNSCERLPTAALGLRHRSWDIKNGVKAKIVSLWPKKCLLSSSQLLWKGKVEEAKDARVALFLVRLRGRSPVL